MADGIVELPAASGSSTTIVSSSSCSISSSRSNSPRDSMLCEKRLGADVAAGGCDFEAVSPLEDGDPEKGKGIEIEDNFEVNWEGPMDPQNPLNWGFWRKLMILMAVSIQTVIVVFYSTSFLSGGPGLMEDLGVKSNTLLAFGMTTYMLGLAAGPVFLAPLSEIYGRRPVYMVSLGLYFIFVLPACLAQNYNTILVVRFFAAFVGSVTISNAPGTIADIYREEHRSLAFSVFLLAPLNGPVLGPLVGGFVFENLGWRWLNWLVFIAAGIFWIVGLLMPETYSPALLRRKAEQLRKETGEERYRSRFCQSADSPAMGFGSKAFWKHIGSNMARPIVLGVTEPVCIFWEIYVAIIYAILYLSFVGYPIVFRGIRGWSPGFAGLAFSGIGVGTVIALCLDPVSRKIYMMHKIDPETGKRPPEAWISILCVASVVSPLALIAFAWTSAPASIHWIWPILCGVPFGMGNTLIFVHANNYLVASYDRYAASALVGNTVARSILGGVLPLFGGKMYQTLGPNWAGTLVGLLAAALVPIPWGFYKWGKKVRLRSPMLRMLQEEKRIDDEKLAKMAELEKSEGKR